ncbi:MAG: HEAT repeat domain-containing protein [Pirellulales bacterium]
MLPLIDDADPKVRRSAIQSLTRDLKSDPVVVRRLVDRLADKDTMVRYAAATWFQYQGKTAEPALPGLIKLVKQDAERNVRNAAADALRTSGEAGVAALADLLSAIDPDVRASALQAFDRRYVDFETAPTPKALQPRFVELLDDNSPNVQYVAAQALVLLEEPPADLTPKLIAHRNEKVRDFIAYRLFTPAERSGELPYKQELLAAVKTDKRMRQRYGRYLGYLGDEAEPLLLEMLDDDSPFVRGEAAKGLARLPTKSEKGVPRLQELLKDMTIIERDTKERVCHAAGETLNRILGTRRYTENLPRLEITGK